MESTVQVKGFWDEELHGKDEGIATCVFIENDNLMLRLLRVTYSRKKFLLNMRRNEAIDHISYLITISMLGRTSKDVTVDTVLPSALMLETHQT